MRAFVIFAIWCVGLCAALPTPTPTTTPTPTPAPCTCPYPGQLWGDVNPNVFNFCDSATNTPQQLSCSSGSGFLKTVQAYGCVPFTQWPSNCINVLASPPICTGVSATIPTEAINPNQYYLCPSVGATAQLLNCPQGQGFLSGNCGAIGCVDWTEWRAAKNCYTY